MGCRIKSGKARLGKSRIHLNCRLQSFTQDDGGVTAYFFDRHGSHRHTARGDVLIGADGIHSLVRFPSPRRMVRYYLAVLLSFGDLVESKKRKAKALKTGSFPAYPVK